MTTDSTAEAVATDTPFYRADQWNPDQSVGLLIKRIGHSIVVHADRRLAEHGLTHAQWVPLMKLHKGECGTIAALARDLQTDAGAMTRALDRIEAKGLVRRTRSLDDRRVINLELTDEGLKLAALVPPVLAQVLNEHLVGFNHDEWQQLVALLQRMVSNGEALRDAAHDTAKPIEPLDE